jgi:DNA polymerase sigma
MKVLNQKTSKWVFGDILDFHIVSKHNSELKLDASIGINKTLGLANSSLMKIYCKIDSRFRDLALILKYINKIYFPRACERIDSYGFT